MTQCLTTGCEREAGPPDAIADYGWTHCPRCEDRIVDNAKAHADIKHSIKVLEKLAVQKFVDENSMLIMTTIARCQDCGTDWPHPSVLSDRPLCPSCRFQREYDLKDEIRKLEDEIETCPAIGQHTKEPEK